MMSQHQVHHNLESVLKVLKEKNNSTDQHINELLDIFYKEMKLTESIKNCESQKSYPFIVIEGLDAAGKSTVSKKLCTVLKAKHRITPPNCIQHLRSGFVNELSISTAFYSLGNYIEGAYINKLIQQSPVILDRFWHSTTAYSLAQGIYNENNLNGLPAAGDCIYEWPSDLIKPSLVIYLDVSEDERVKRHETRNTTNTKQESLLKESKVFRQNVRTAYERMHDPSVDFINGNISVNDIVSCILKKIENIRD